MCYTAARQEFSPTQVDDSLKNTYYKWHQSSTAIPQKMFVALHTEPTSLCKATSLNFQNVKLFFDKLVEGIDKYLFRASQIWNVDCPLL